MLDYVVKHMELLQCEIVCKSLKVTWKGLKCGVGKDQYVAQNVVKAVVVSTSYLFRLTTIRKCVGLNRRSLRRVVHQRQMLDAKRDGEYWDKGDRKIKKDAILRRCESYCG
jgi:hypothetical protein